MDELGRKETASLDEVVRANQGYRINLQKMRNIQTHLAQVVSFAEKAQRRLMEYGIKFRPNK